MTVKEFRALNPGTYVQVIQSRGLVYHKRYANKLATVVKTNIKKEGRNTFRTITIKFLHLKKPQTWAYSYLQVLGYEVHATQGQGSSIGAAFLTEDEARGYVDEHKTEGSFGIKKPDGTWVQWGSGEQFSDHIKTLGAVDRIQSLE